MMFIFGASFLVFGCLACGANSEILAASLEHQASQVIVDGSETQPNEEKELAGDRIETQLSMIDDIGIERYLQSSIGEE